jgi:hypothetical protein
MKVERWSNIGKWAFPSKINQKEQIAKYKPPNPIPIFKNKAIQKTKKPKKCASLDIDAPLHHPLLQISGAPITHNNKIIVELIRNIREVFDLPIDTYLACLKLATAIKFSGEPRFCKHVAGTIALMVHKLYETYRFSFGHIYQWS